MKARSIFHLTARLVVLFITVVSVMPVMAQDNPQYALYNYRNDGDFNAWLNIDIDSITYSCIDTLGIEHDDVVVQEVWTPDSVYRIPLEVIDSIGFRAPKPVMREGIFYLRDYHAAHTMAIDSLTLYFDASILNDSLPTIGQVVLHGVFTHPYEEGFAGKVKNIRNENGYVVVDCEMLCVADVYKRLVMVGRAISETAAGKKAKSKRAEGNPWVKYEDSDVIIKDIGDIELKVLDGLFFVNSINPTLQINYNVYVDEDIYDMAATVRLTHNDLEYGIDLNLNKILAIEDTISADKEWKNVTQALQRMQNYKDMSHEDWVKSIVEETKQKGEKEKIDKDQASLLDTMWKKLHKSWTIPIGGPFVVDIEVGPLLDLKGSIDIQGKLKTKARNTIFVEAKGSTIASLANVPVALATGKAEINGYSSFNIEPAKSLSLGIKAKGSLDVGVMGKASISLIHKGVVHATGSFKGGLKLAGEIGFSWDSESAYSGDYSSYNALYTGVKDTKIKLEAFACAGVELGITPWKFLTAGAEWEIWQKELGSCYLFPHFSMPSLPTYDYSKEQWSNGNFNNHLVLQSLPTKNIPEFLLGPCKVGLKIFDKNGNPVRETDEREYRDDGTLVWQLFPLEIDLNGLTRGNTYRCYPVLRYHDWWQLGASPSYEFTVPNMMTLGITDWTIKAGEERHLTLNGGWGPYQIINGDETIAMASFQKTNDANEISYFNDMGPGGGGGSAWRDGLVSTEEMPKVYIKGINVGETTIQVKDMRSNETVSIKVTVTDKDFETLQLSATTLTLTTGQQGTVDITSGSGSYDAVSNDKSVATVTVEGSKLIIKAVGAGTAIITVKDNQTQERAKIEVTVSNTNTPAGLKAVDLGLPSGTLWANMNVGADKPEEYGGYYSWGETEEKESYTNDNYNFVDIGRNISGTNYDAAHVNWGGDWCMPTMDEFNELMNNCSHSWTTINGVKGMTFTGFNGNSIFLPAAGKKYSSNTEYANQNGFYRAATCTPYYMIGYIPDAIPDFFALEDDEWAMPWEDDGASIRPVLHSIAFPVNSLVVTQTEINFDLVSLGTDKKKTFKVVNTKDHSVTFHVSSDKQFTDYFEVTDTDMGFTLAPNETKEFVVTSHGMPSGHTARTSILVTSDDGDQEQKVMINSYGWDYLFKSIPDTMAVGESVNVSIRSSDFDFKCGYDIPGTIIEGDWVISAEKGGSSSEHGKSRWPDSYHLYASVNLQINAKEEGLGVIFITDNITGKKYERYIKVVNTDDNQAYLTCPDDHHPHLIDLGLPSGTKWACCNVGADAPESYGGYYAWGETEEKSVYNWSTYTHCDGSSDTCHDLGSDIAGTQYDVAHVKWGGSWVMPSEEQQNELRRNCTSTWTTQNGVNGRIFTGPNGGSIFLPAAGDRYFSDLYHVGSDGRYWSSTQDPSDSYYAYLLYFDSGGKGRWDYGRLIGQSVRPVVRN